jgi:predicted DNA-binding transcriptional regulator AlpA
MTNDSDEKWISIKQLSDRINMSVSHLRALFRAGNLPGAKRVGPRFIRVNWEEFKREQMS